MRSNSTFFISGLISAIFQFLAKTPWHKDTLTSLVVKGAVDGNNFFSSLVGIVSNLHDFVGIEFIILITSLVESALKCLNVPSMSAVG